MKMCQRHWDAMRAEVEAQGLSGWVATTGETAAAQLADQAQRGESTPVNYDPLMDAHNMILSRALDGLGLVVMSAEFGCPICFLTDRISPDGACTCGHPDCPNGEPGSLSVEMFEGWLRGPESAVAAARAHMVEQGWLPADPHVAPL